MIVGIAVATMVLSSAARNMPGDRPHGREDDAAPREPCAAYAVAVVMSARRR